MESIFYGPHEMKHKVFHYLPFNTRRQLTKYYKEYSEEEYQYNKKLILDKCKLKPTDDQITNMITNYIKIYGDYEYMIMRWTYRGEQPSGLYIDIVHINKNDRNIIKHLTSNIDETSENYFESDKLDTYEEILNISNANFISSDNFYLFRNSLLNYYDFIFDHKNCSISIIKEILFNRFEKILYSSGMDYPSRIYTYLLSNYILISNRLGDNNTKINNRTGFKINYSIESGLSIDIDNKRYQDDSVGILDSDTIISISYQLAPELNDDIEFLKTYIYN